MPLGAADLFWIGIVPLAAAAAAMLGGVLLEVRPNARWAASVAAGIVIGTIGLNLRVSAATAAQRLLHPHVAHDWLPWLVAVAAGIGILTAYSPASWRLPNCLLAGALAIAVPVRLLANNAAAMSRWSPFEKLGVIALWAAVFSALWYLLAAGRTNGMPLVRGGLLVVAAFGTALTLAASASLTLGELGGIATSTLLGAASGSLARFWFGATAGLPSSALDTLSSQGTATNGGGFMDPSGAAGPLAAMLGGLILIGHHFASLSSTSAGLLLVSIAAAAGRLPRLPLPLGAGWGEGVLRAALCLVPLSIAVAAAVSAALADPYG